jgi:hypothetical protein
VLACGPCGPARQEIIVNHIHRICRSLASLTRRAGFLLARHAAVPAVPAATRAEPPRWTTRRLVPAPARTIAVSEPRVGVRQPPRERLRARAAPARLPHAIQLCVHCQQNPAGFWVSRTAGKTVRRPLCLSCCEGLDRDRCDMILFER